MPLTTSATLDGGEGKVRAITISVFTFLTAATMSFASWTLSLTVLFIFQLPAMMY